MARAVISKVGLFLRQQLQQKSQQRKWLVVGSLFLFLLLLLLFRQPASDNAVQGTHHNASDTFVSAIEPIELSQAKGVPQTIGNDSVNSSAGRAELEQQFQQASALKAKGATEKAAQIYQKLISDYPQIVESYINLAKIQSDNGQLEKARVTLTSGLKANENIAVLYANLQQIHGSIAAKAYHKVLDSPTTSVSSPDLTSIDSLDSRPASDAELLRLRSQLDALVKEKQQQETQVAQLRAELQTSQQQLVLAQQLQQSKPVASSVAQVETTTLAENIEVAETIDEPAALTTDVTEVVTAAPVVEVAETVEMSEAVETPTTSEEGVALLQRLSNEKAENLVKSWAKAWSDQNVEQYLRHYSDDYRPLGSSLSHKEWVDQRHIRLTNKKFIKVKVSDFEVVDMSDKFAVNFNQHYQSERINDRIKKQLVFEKEGDNWLNAKIVKEQVLRF